MNNNLPPIPRVITDSHELAEFCDQLAQQPYVCIDTEFMREKTYWPKFCLAQLAGAQGSGIKALVDPLAPDLDLTPLYELVCDKPVVKVFHAARQDMELFWNICQRLPNPIFDTQLAASVCGYGDQISYDNLVSELAGQQIDKSARLTDWAHRPMGAKAMVYAMGDVLYLGKVYEKIREKLEKSGRLHWMDEEMAILTDIATYNPDPAEAWRRLRRTTGGPRYQLLLRHLCAWRERKAQERDLPRSRILKDESLMDIAAHATRTPETLERARAIAKGYGNSAMGQEIISEVLKALETPEQDWPQAEKAPPRLTGVQQVTLELLKQLLRLIATDAGIAAKMIATSDDLDAFVRDPTGSHKILKGWRFELFGKSATDLLKGELFFGLSPEQGGIRIIPASQMTIKKDK